MTREYECGVVGVGGCRVSGLRVGRFELHVPGTGRKVTTAMRPQLDAEKCKSYTAMICSHFWGKLEHPIS